MKLPVLYSLPPACQKIPLKTITRSIKGLAKYSSDSLLNPLRDFLGTRNIYYLTSGRAALWLLLKTLSRINPGRLEVILPAYTCPAVASAVLKAGLKPILCDNNLSDFGFAGEELQKKINKNTLAVIVVHLFGYPANIQEVKDCCRQYNAFVVEDAAQAFGNSLVDSSEEKLGLLGAAGFFSFGRGKPINVMHGGIFVTGSEEIYLEAGKVYENLDRRVGLQPLKYKIVLALSIIFSNPFLYWIPQRIPFLDLGKTIFEPDFTISHGIDCAASLISKLIESTEIEKEIREKNALWYSINVERSSVVGLAPSSQFPYIRYPLLINNRDLRDRILAELMARGTGAGPFYPSPLNELAGLGEQLNDNNIYPNARTICDSLITLPVHRGVTPMHRVKIKSIIQRSFARYVS